MGSSSNGYGLDKGRMKTNTNSPEIEILELLNKWGKNENNIFQCLEALEYAKCFLLCQIRKDDVRFEEILDDHTNENYRKKFCETVRVMRQKYGKLLEETEK